MNLFQKLFGTREKKLSKIEYWKKWEFSELFDDLHEAEKLLTSGQFNGNGDVEIFKRQFIEELYEIEGDNVADFTRMWIWFSPGEEWDNKIGRPGSELAERIFRRIDRWKRNQEFVPGT